MDGQRRVHGLSSPRRRASTPFVCCSCRPSRTPRGSHFLQPGKHQRYEEAKRKNATCHGLAMRRDSLRTGPTSLGRSDFGDGGVRSCFFHPKRTTERRRRRSRMDRRSLHGTMSRLRQELFPEAYCFDAVEQSATERKPRPVGVGVGVDAWLSDFSPGYSINIVPTEYKPKKTKVNVIIIRTLSRSSQQI